ncbi:Geranylgeranyl transferase type-1 subunit beta [Gaertneriomyces sp. JEL0708]|nr:Geranylgeranyl transferase type-1 subunit beta [Gaertneriomyces sp. JEL0708]
MTETLAGTPPNDVEHDDFPQSSFQKDIRYFKAHAQMLPHHYTSGETNRALLGYFCVSALDILNALDTEITGEQRKAWIDWVYSQQLEGGFRGAPFAATPTNNDYNVPHLTMTYTSLLLLMTLGDDLSRVNRSSIVQYLKSSQNENGSYPPFKGSPEKDMRFLYCACAVSYILQDWSGVDKDRAAKYILKSLNTWEGGFGQDAGLEAHGGSTYCALASLALMSRLDAVETHKDQLIAWLVSRQTEGFNGRPNKDADTCYSFWVGASLTILGSYDMVDTVALQAFLATTHTKHGGFGKIPGAYPDILHAYLGLCGLSLSNLDHRIPIAPIHAALCTTERVVAFMKNDSAYWRG